MTTTSNKLYSSDNSREEDEILLQPYNYSALINAEVKRSLNLFWSAFNHWLDVPEEKLQQVFDLLKIQYNIFFIADDIQDGSVNRNGNPTPDTIFGLGRTLTAVNYANILSVEQFMKLERPEVMDYYIRYMMEFFKGQGMEIYWRDNYICPTEEEYRKMIYYKSKGPLKLGVRLMQLFSDNKSDFQKIMEIAGDFVQIHNDYISLQTEKYMDLKSYYEDITEGKFSFPIIHAIRSHPEDDQIMNIIKMRTTNLEMKKSCVALMEKYGSFEYTRRVLEDLRRQGEEEMKKLGDNPSIMQIFDHCLDKLNEFPVMI